MSQELIYTSAPQGLKPGSKGFSTVAITAGLPTAWIERLESLSGYRPIYPLGDPSAQKNPVNQSHWRITIAGKQRSVLSRVAFAGADYSGRSNKLGHHIVVEPGEQAPGGPAWLMLKPGVMRTGWTDNPQQLPAGPTLPTGDRRPSSANTWASALGDAGWAAFLAESFATEGTKPAYLICSPGTNVLALFEESLALLPPARRWEVTFSTFFSELPLNLNCAWRAVIAGTPAATEALRMGQRVRLLDLTKPAGTAPSGLYADAARAGSGPVIVRTLEVGKVLATQRAAVPMAEDPEDTKFGIALAGENALSAANKPLRRGNSRRLNPAVGAGSVTEELPDLSDLSEPIQDGLSPPPVVVYRGVRTTIVAAIASACVLIGMGIGLAIDRLYLVTGKPTAINTPTTQPIGTIALLPSAANPVQSFVPTTVASQAALQTTKPVVNAQPDLPKQPAAGTQSVVQTPALKIPTTNPDIAYAAEATKGELTPVSPPGGNFDITRRSSSQPIVTDRDLAMTLLKPEKSEMLDNAPMLWISEPVPMTVAQLDGSWTLRNIPNHLVLNDITSITMAWPDNNSTHTMAIGGLPTDLVVIGSGRIFGVIDKNNIDHASAPASKCILIFSFDGATLKSKAVDRSNAGKLISELCSCVLIAHNSAGSVLAKIGFDTGKRDMDLSSEAPDDVPVGPDIKDFHLTSSLDSDRWKLEKLPPNPHLISYENKKNSHINFSISAASISPASAKLNIKWDWAHWYPRDNYIASKISDDWISDYKQVANNADPKLALIIKDAKPHAAAEVNLDTSIAAIENDPRFAGRDANGAKAAQKAKEEDPLNSQKQEEDRQFQEEIKKVRAIRDRKKALIEDAKLNDFDVKIVLPNGLDFLTIHLKPDGAIKRFGDSAPP
jgi:hypothetical protein